MLSENVRELKMWLQEEKVSEITPTEDSEQSEVDYSQGESLKAWVSEGRESLSLRLSRGGEGRESVHCSRPAGLLSTELSCLYCCVGNRIYTRNHNKNHPKPIKKRKISRAARALWARAFFFTRTPFGRARQSSGKNFKPLSPLGRAKTVLSCLAPPLCFHRK